VDAALPTGTVTLLFTDIEGSTRLLDRLGADYAGVLAEHHRLLRDAWARHDGVEVETAGDAFFVAFSRARDGIAAAAAAQAALADQPLRVRMGVHTGEPVLTETGYVGMDVHRAARIAAAAHGGQVLVSQATRELLGEAGLRDLGAHRLKDLSAPERLYQLGDEDFPPLKSLHQTNLPVQATALIGREPELAQVTSLIRGSARLVTLTGPGGTGKTRLALHAAAELADDFPDGVWFVPLAPIADPTLVEPTISQVVGARDDLARHLQDKRLLLVLDNLEQILDAAVAIAALLENAPGVVVVATSRERLAVAAEHEYPVPPLPDEDAAALFTDRARRLAPSFVRDEHVDAIARRLDGLPLALELAAARIKVLSPAEIEERLGRSLELLTGGGRDAPERQRTLRATIDWSFALLEDEERRVLTEASVFAGSFEREGAEAVCGALLDTIGSLVDKSLLRRRPDGRFFLLQTIREFALEKLAETDDRAVRARLAGHVTERVVELDRLLRGPHEVEAVASFVLEIDNVRVVLDHLESSEDAARHAAVVNACWYFWYLLGLFAEARPRVNRAVARIPELVEDQQADVYEAASGIVALSGNVELGIDYAKRALAIRRRIGGDERLLLRSLNQLIVPMGLAGGHFPESRALLEELVELAVRLDERWWIAQAKGNLGCVEFQDGRFEEARVLLEEALSLGSSVGNEHLVAGTSINLAAAELELGLIVSARRRLLAVLEQHRDQFEFAIWSLAWLSAAEASSGRDIDAAQMLGAIAALTADVGYTLPTMEFIRVERTRTHLERTLGAERLEREIAVGAAADRNDLLTRFLSRGA
jgi:predicted ATPase